MYVSKAHERQLEAHPADVGALIDSLGSSTDRLWPRDRWPRLVLDRPLSIGANGGHGKLRYYVEDWQPGTSIRFRFTEPPGVEGWHGFEVEPVNGSKTVLRHRLEVQTRGLATGTWPLVLGPLHDALIMDSLAKAERKLGLEERKAGWSPWVKVLRVAMARKKRKLIML